MLSTYIILSAFTYIFLCRFLSFLGVGYSYHEIFVGFKNLNTPPGLDSPDSKRSSLEITSNHDLALHEGAQTNFECTPFFFLQPVVYCSFLLRQTMVGQGWTRQSFVYLNRDRKLWFEDLNGRACSWHTSLWFNPWHVQLKALSWKVEWLTLAETLESCGQSKCPVLD